jgi:hypothetical protein
MEAAAVAHCPSLSINPLIVPGLPIIFFIDQNPKTNTINRTKPRLSILFLTKIPGRKKSLLYRKLIIKTLNP